MEKIRITAHQNKVCKRYPANSRDIPKELFEIKNEKPDLTGFPYPLPSAKKDYTCYAESNGIKWFGATTGLTRYEENAEYPEDRVMYFSAPRDLPNNNVKALLCKGDVLWVLTYSGVASIQMKKVTGEEKADILLAESKKYIDRYGMVSHRHIAEPFNLESAYPFGHCDNDGGFTACYAVGEILRYATFKREKGLSDPATLQAKADATRAVEACLMLMHIHGRGDGFMARSYVLTSEPLPDDGFFFRRQGNKAVCMETTASKKCGYNGLEIDCSAEIPERLLKLIPEGFTLDDVIYKADTSSDEVTMHMLELLFAHRYLCPEDEDLDDLIKVSVTKLVDHIIDNGFVFKDFHGGATTWAKWNEDYFHTEDGYVDAALNSAELLFYIKAGLDICGENKKWQDTYEYLINERHYADISEMHYDRLTQLSFAENTDKPELIMFGDHMLAAISFFGLGILETDEELLKKYRYGYKTWRTTMMAEHNPGYDYMYKIACPDEEIDNQRLATWFRRMNLSRLAAGVSCVGRHDVAVKTTRGGYKLMSALLPPDESFISKYDRDPLEYKNSDSGGEGCIESCYVYTFAYWMGRYFGFIDGEEK